MLQLSVVITIDFDNKKEKKRKLLNYVLNCLVLNLKFVD